MLIIISLLLMTSTTFAQLPGFTPEQNDAKPAPISSTSFRIDRGCGLWDEEDQTVVPL